MGLRHLTAATLPDDPSKEVSSGEWNEDHKFTDANIGALLVRGASSDLVAGVSSVATGQVLVSQGAGSLPVWSSTPTLSGLTLGGHLTFSGAFNIGDGAGNSPVSIYAEGAFLAPDGTAGAPSHSFASDSDTGMYLDAGGPNLRFSRNGTLIAQITATGLDIIGGEQLRFGGSTDVVLTRQAAGRLVLMPATATPSGGSVALALVFGSTSGFGIYIGSGAPTVSAAQGSLYLRSDGSGTTNRAYINNSAGSGTTWTALTTAA